MGWDFSFLPLSLDDPVGIDADVLFQRKLENFHSSHIASCALLIRGGTGRRRVGR